MLKFCHQNKGAISVFLTLILLPMLLLGGMTADAARIYASRVVISDAGEMAMNAGLAQYNEKLHDEYGLLVMDKSPEDMEAALKGYFEKSLNGNGISGAEDYARILDLVVEQFDAINLAGSQIYKTEVEKQQIVEYMKYRAPICLTELLVDKFGELKDTERMAQAMEAQMEFGEAMEECQDSMEEAKAALDRLNTLINQYPTRGVIESELNATWIDYTTRVSRCLLMLAAISHYTQADARGSAEASARSFVSAAAGVSVGSDADSESSFNSYMSCLYYRQGVVNAGGLDSVLNAHRAAKPEEDDPAYPAWTSRMTDLENLKNSYNSAGISISGYPNQLRKIAYEDCIVPHTDTLHDYREKSQRGYEYAKTAYEKLEIVKQKLEEASGKWHTWSEKTNALGEKAGSMKDSVDEYGKFFADGDPANDMDNLGLLMEDVKTDQIFFNEMRDILTEEKFFDLSIAVVSAASQYTKYLNKANAVAGSDMGTFTQIEDKRDPSYKANYNHMTVISTSHLMMRIDSSPFYNKLREYCSSSDTAEANAKKNEVNGKLNESKTAGESAESESGYPTYEWTMDGNMPSVLLGLVAPDDASGDLTDVGGDVNGKSGRKSAIAKFKSSIGQAASFLDGLNRIIADNLENLYVAEYAMQMFSYYTVNKDDGVTLANDKVISLSGYKLSEHKPYRAEVEYILWGNSSSKANVRNTVMTIFGIRLLFNSLFAFTNAELTNEARAMATVIAGAAPYLIPVVQVIIQLAFAGIETAVDTSKIKDGYGVTIIKSRESWTGLGGDNTRGITLDYSEYLRIFLNVNMLTGLEVNKLARIADCIRVNTDYDMANGYTMLAIESRVGVRTTFMKKISDMGYGEWAQPDNTYPVIYQSILGY